MTPILLPATNRKTIIALKTNLLYDLITALNFEIEIPIGNKFSIAVEDVFPWWSWGPHDRKYCFQMWEMGIEPRWWFRRTDEREVLTGQFFGEMLVVIARNVVTVITRYVGRPGQQHDIARRREY